MRRSMNWLQWPEQTHGDSNVFPTGPWPMTGGAGACGYVSIANTACGSNAERSKSVNWFSDFSQYREWPVLSNIQS